MSITSCFFTQSIEFIVDSPFHYSNNVAFFKTHFYIVKQVELWGGIVRGLYNW